MFKEVTTANTDPVILLADLKTYANFNTTEQDDQFNDLIDQASIFVKKYLQRPVLNETWLLTYDKNELCNKMNLQGLKVSAILSYTVIDVNGDSNVVTSTKYRLSNNNIIFDTSTSAGALDGNNGRTYDAVQISVTAGIGATESVLPDDFKLGMYALVLHWQQTNVIDFDDAYKFIPPAFKKAMTPYINMKSWVG